MFTLCSKDFPNSEFNADFNDNNIIITASLLFYGNHFFSDIIFEVILLSIIHNIPTRKLRLENEKTEILIQMRISKLLKTIREQKI